VQRSSLPDNIGNVLWEEFVEACGFLWRGARRTTVGFGTFQRSGGRLNSPAATDADALLRFLGPAPAYSICPGGASRGEALDLPEFSPRHALGVCLFEDSSQNNGLCRDLSEAKAEHQFPALQANRLIHSPFWSLADPNYPAPFPIALSSKIRVVMRC
jgi:hypothetical protein